MYVKTRFILILALGAWVCAACQQRATAPPASDTPLREPAASPQPEADIEGFAVTSDTPLNKSTASPQLVTNIEESAVVASDTPSSESTASLQLDPDIVEYAVYNDLLESEYASDNIKQILIIDHTRADPPRGLEEDVTEYLDNEFAPELVASFRERNQQPYPLKPILDFGLEYQLLSQEEVNKIKPTDEASKWKYFREKWPQAHGFVYLSRVGFNADLSQALVYICVYHYDQPLLGSYNLMVKQDGHWVVEGGYQWIT